MKPLNGSGVTGHTIFHTPCCRMTRRKKFVSELSLMKGDSISTGERHHSETKPATGYLGNEGPIFHWNLATLAVDRVWGAGERSGWEP